MKIIFNSTFNLKVHNNSYFRAIQKEKSFLHKNIHMKSNFNLKPLFKSKLVEYEKGN